MHEKTQELVDVLDALTEELKQVAPDLREALTLSLQAQHLVGDDDDEYEED